MAETVGDRIVKRLREWNVERIYGYPGDGINGILAGLSRSDNDPFFVQSRHEEMAAFMACAHAKWTGEAGVCLATSEPGRGMRALVLRYPWSFDNRKGAASPSGAVSTSGTSEVVRITVPAPECRHSLARSTIVPSTRVNEGRWPRTGMQD